MNELDTVDLCFIVLLFPFFSLDFIVLNLPFSRSLPNHLTSSLTTIFTIQLSALCLTYDPLSLLKS